MRRFALLCAALAASQAAAETGWTRLTGAEVAAALTDRTVVYDNTARQRFFASGRTRYTTAQDSWGYWEARGDQYCSRWPRADGWVCYDLETRPQQVRFIGAAGDVTAGIRQ